MKRRALISILALALPALSILAQTSTSSALFDSPAPQNKNESAEKKPAEAEPKKSNGAGASLTKSDQPITTEITAEQAFFDSAKNIGVFTGHVVVTDPRFSIQSDKLTAYISKQENQGLEKAVADGNVGVVRDRPDPNGGPPTRSVGRSEHAVYTASDGNVEMTGNPRVQQGMNMHIATQEDTVMILNQAGQLTTHGPSRTEIRREQKTDASPNGSPKPASSPKNSKP